MRRIGWVALMLSFATGVSAQVPAWVGRDTLVCRLGSDARSLDPVQVDDGSSVTVIDTLYETLLRIGADRRPQPLLASRWSAMDGAHGYVFTIRANVRFHDGTPLTAAVVAASLDRLRASGSGYLSMYRSIRRVTAVDDQVQVETHGPDATLPYKLAMFPAAIVSPAAVARHGARYGLDAAVGTGPFRLVRWVRGERIELRRNARYWGQPAGVGRLEFRVVRLVADGRAALRRGELSYLGHSLVGPPIPGVIRVSRPVGTEISLCYLALNTQRAPLNNVAFRRTIARALDKRALAALYGGLASPLDVPVPPGINGHSAAVRGPGYEVAAARRLLAGSGVGQRGLTLTVMANPRPYILDPVAVAQTIAAQLGRIGITVTIERLAWKTFLDHVQAGRHQLCLLGWTTDDGDADNFVSTLLHSRNAQVGRALNMAFFKDPAMDRLIEQQRAELDGVRRAAILEQIYRRTIDQAPLVPLVAVRDRLEHHRLLDGVTLGPVHQRGLWRIRIRR